MKIILKEFIGWVPKNHVTCCKMFDNVPLINNVEEQIAILKGWCMNMGYYSTGSKAEGLNWPPSSDNNRKQ